MQSVQGSTPAPPSYYNSLCCHAKQYWPVWIYKGAFAGAGFGQYALNRWDVVVGFAGCGLIATYVLSYFSKGQEGPVVPPQAVRDYEEQNRENIAGLEEVRSDVDAAEKGLSEALTRMKTDRRTLSRNTSFVVGNNEALRDLSEAEEKESEALKEVTAAGVNQNQQLRAMEEGTAIDRRALEESTLSLEQITAQAQQLLMQWR